MNEEIKLIDIVEIEDERTQQGEKPFQHLEPLRHFRGNYGVPRRKGNTVIKGFFQADTETINKLTKLQQQYHDELNKHIPIIPTQIHQKGNLFYLTQPYTKGQTFEEILQIYTMPTTKKVNTNPVNGFQQITQQCIQLIQNSTKQIGIDAKPENWIINEQGQAILLDTFPPIMIDQEQNFKNIFNKRSFEVLFNNNPERSYFRNLTKILTRLMKKSQIIYDKPAYGFMCYEALAKYDHQNQYKTKTAETFKRYMPTSI